MHADPRPRSRPLFLRLRSSSAARYLIVGGLSFLFDIGMLWLLHDGIGVPLAAATAVAFLLSFVVTYALQRTVTFHSSNAVAPSVLRYAILVIFNTFATTAIVWALDAIGLRWEIGKVVAVAATTLWNYLAYRYWVFAGRRRMSDV